MGDSCLVWHYGGNMVNDSYRGGDEFNQIVDTDRLSYWCLLEHAKSELKQREPFKLYFRNRSKGNLVEVYNDATTCELLDILNEKKECDVYVVNYGEGSTVLCDADMDRNEVDESTVNVRVKDSWQFKDLLNEIRIDEVGEVGEADEVGEAEGDETVGEAEGDETDTELEEEEYVDVNEEFLSDGDDLELQEARKNLKKLDTIRSSDDIVNGMQHQCDKRNDERNEEAANEESNGDTDYIDSSDCSYVDTDEEMEVTGGRHIRKFPTYNAQSSKVSFSIGMTFEGANQFKEALTRYSIMERRELIYTKNTQQYVRSKCKKPKCHWFICGAKDRRTGVFQIIKYVDDHQCGTVNKLSKLTYKKLADLLVDKFDSIPTVKLIHLQNLVKKELKLDVSLLQCWRAKAVAYDKLKGNATEEFAKLWRYVLEIRRAHDGNSALLETSDDNTFKRIICHFMHTSKVF